LQIPKFPFSQHDNTQHDNSEGKSKHLQFLSQHPTLLTAQQFGSAAPLILALFIRLTIRLSQLVFSAGTVFFSHNKSVNSVFQPAYQHS
jgi:hypothetical protein